ncbi:MAG TPA: MBL fold metallo-hydrolase [Vicinamibacterales bacterium]|nr:MBL fold metallo-hydrolase [Vicinamibacterales bacterium]
MKPIAVHAFNPSPLTGDGNTTWLLPGHVPTLIDAGTGEPQHLEALERALDGARLAQVLVTHSHVDHASGAAAIAEKMPHVRFLKMPWPDHDRQWHVRWEPLTDAEVVPAGDSSLIAIHTPGHSPDHLCFWEQEGRLLFCGDLAWQGSTVVIPPSLGGDVASYLASLERVIALDPVEMLPAHGPVIDHPIELMREYIEHRALREQQVVAALRIGITDPTQMVARIYPSLARPLVPVARESVLAHLVKLEREGKARRDGDAWHIIEP